MWICPRVTLANWPSALSASAPGDGVQLLLGSVSAQCTAYDVEAGASSSIIIIVTDPACCSACHCSAHC